jgi:HSP20 family protein
VSLVLRCPRVTSQADGLVRGALQYAAVAHIYGDRRTSDNDRQFRRLIEEEDAGGAAGECVPPMDVVETPDGIEIVMDLPGIPAAAVRLVFSQGTVFVVGRKRAATCAHGQAAFHLAERSFGRFARAVRLNGAFDAGRASATLTGGELRIVLPRIEERRGRDIRIDITPGP